jgi:protein-tyrosine phosphatase
LPIVQQQAAASLKQKVLKGEADSLDGEVFMKDAYQFMAGEGLGQIVAFLQLAREDGNWPILFHCNAGKDRTGFAATLLLKCLGASDEVVFYDYLLSNTYRKLINQEWTRKGSYFLNAERIAPFLEVRSDYLNTSLSQLARSYPTLEQFFVERANWSPEDRQRWRAQLVEKI